MVRRCTVGERRPACLLAWALGVVLWAPGNASATISASVFPTLLDFQVAPGETRMQTVRFLNDGDAAVRVMSEVWDLTWDGDRGQVVSPPADRNTSAASWVTMYPEGAIAQAHGFVDVAVTVGVPRGARGGYYAMLFLTGAPAVDVSTGAVVPIATRFGIHVLIRTPDARSQLTARISSVSPPTSHDKLRMTVELTNATGVHVWAEPGVDLIGPMDDFVAHVVPERPRVLVPPKQTRKAEFTWGGQIAPAKYEAVATVYYDGDQVTADQMSFDVVPETIKSPPTGVAGAANRKQGAAAGRQTRASPTVEAANSGLETKGKPAKRPAKGKKRK